MFRVLFISIIMAMAGTMTGKFATEKSCTADLPSSVQQARKGSKYVVEPNFKVNTQLNNSIASHISRCEELGLTMAGSAHIVDWKSLQTLLRDFTNYAVANGLGYDFGYVNPGDDGTRWIYTLGDFDNVESNRWTSVTGNGTPFIVWDHWYDAPSDTTRKHITIAGFLADNKELKYTNWSLVAKDRDDTWNKDDSIARLLCQYPTESHCFKQSIEEKDFAAKYQGGANKLTRLKNTDNSQLTWYITNSMMSARDAVDFCEDHGYDIWDGNYDNFPKYGQTSDGFNRMVLKHFDTIDVQTAAISGATEHEMIHIIWDRSYGIKVKRLVSGHSDAGGAPPILHALCVQYC